MKVLELLLGLAAFEVLKPMILEMMRKPRRRSERFIEVHWLFEKVS